MNKGLRPQEEAFNSRSEFSENASDNESEEYLKNGSGKDHQKFKQLKESKRRFLHELNEGPMQGDMKQRMDVLVKKAESLANFLLTKHKYKE